MTLSHRGDPKNLTWALFDFPEEVHAVPGRFTVGVRPEWPGAHEQSASCWCQPLVTLDSEAAPKPLIEHRQVAS